LRFLWQLGGGSPEAYGSEAMMPNLRGFLYALAAGSVSRSWVGPAAVIGSVATFALISRRWAGEAGDPSVLDLLFSMQVVTAVIVSYHLFVHDASVLLLPIVLTMNRLAGSNRRMSSGVSFALGASISCLYAIPMIAPLRVSMPLFFCASGLLLGGLYMLPGTAGLQLERGRKASCAAMGSALPGC